jgi:hypothetical protein
MKVSLGTLEITDEQRKAIRKDLGHRGGQATRDDVKKYLGAVIDNALKSAGGGQVTTMTGATSSEGSLPEPTAGGSTTATSTSTGGTAPSTGNLGASGTPGGTV